MVSLVRFLDWCLTWVERLQAIPGGAAVVTGITTGLVALWASFSALPAVVVFVLVFCFCVAIIVLQEHLYVFRRYLSPPIIVRIKGFGHLGFAESKQAVEDLFTRTGMRASPTATLRAPIYILNRSSRRRVSLEISVFIIQPRNGVPLQMHGGVEIDAQLDLGPHEASRGHFQVIAVPEGYLDSAERTLIVEDIISGRRARVLVPGRFPPKR